MKEWDRRMTSAYAEEEERRGQGAAGVDQGRGRNPAATEQDWRTDRPKVGNKRHRPFFTNCGTCGNRDFCRKCFKCKDWLCNGCQPFLRRVGDNKYVVDPNCNGALCRDCSCELSGC
eukprot:2083528-Rhodomonas_salina.1